MLSMTNAWGAPCAHAVGTRAPGAAAFRGPVPSDLIGAGARVPTRPAARLRTADAGRPPALDR